VSIQHNLQRFPIEGLSSESPYFLNAGLLCKGSLIAPLAAGYAHLIATHFSGQFDVIFGPAYKGIPLAAATALVLQRDHNMDFGYAFDRKEVKDHGEGGRMVGTPVNGQRVLILDDVMTAGTAVRNAISLIKQEGGEVIGFVMCLDREEIGPGGGSTVKEIEAFIGRPGSLKSILKMSDLTWWLEENGTPEQVKSMKEYQEKYGIKHL